MTVLYTSDLHFNHSFVSKLRGYTQGTGSLITGDTEAHDEMIITKWNKAVRIEDRVFIAGDFAVIWDHKLKEKLRRLNGEKILVTGNHDVMAGNHRDGWKHVGDWIGEGKFAGITSYARRRIGKREIVISHYPYEGDHTGRDRHTQFRLRDEGRWLFHGHTHSAEKMEYKPMLLSTFGGPPSLRNRMIHVGVDAWAFTPVKEHVLVKMMDEIDAEYGITGPDRYNPVLREDL